MTSDILEYKLVYQTKNHYPKGASEALFELLVLPCTNEYQTLKHYALTVEPHGEHTLQNNCFGFQTINISYREPIFSFFFEIRSSVEAKINELFAHTFLQPQDENTQLHAIEYQVDNYLFLRQTPFTALLTEQIAAFPLWQINDENLFAYLKRLCSAIYERYDFCPISTNVHTTATLTFEIGKGVCQDFAHLFLGICRTQNIAARYVSGYLHQGQGYKGDAQLHAWVEVCIPNVGWIGFDPTNNLLADEHYVKIAHGIDYSDCAPIKGVLKSHGEMHTEYSVYVRLESEQ